MTLCVIAMSVSGKLFHRSLAETLQRQNSVETVPDKAVIETFDAITNLPMQGERSNGLMMFIDIDVILTGLEPGEKLDALANERNLLRIPERLQGGLIGVARSFPAAPGRNPLRKVELDRYFERNRYFPGSAKVELGQGMYFQSGVIIVPEGIEKSKGIEAFLKLFVTDELLKRLGKFIYISQTPDDVNDVANYFETKDFDTTSYCFVGKIQEELKDETRQKCE